ncbi:MAG: pseudouridine synthase [Porticoccaceae bacterium]|nr:pseudouridine synthase [Porticoccaceae bacterium]
MSLSTRTRLDRFISRQLNIKRGDVRPLLAKSRILVDGRVAKDIQQTIHQFSHVVFDGQTLQDNTPRYVMMHKPIGVVSATQDDQHQTVIDLLDPGQHDKLHIAGRLDFNSSGLLLLTNDGRWSRHLCTPGNNIHKRYRVELEKPLTEDYIRAFAEGMSFDYENITTQPAHLKIISKYIAEVSLVEGRYHQIKRMFGRFQNRVLQLHRLSIGALSLDQSLLPGQSRALTRLELKHLGCPDSVLDKR